MGEGVAGGSSRLFEAGDLRALYAIEEVCFEASVRFSRSLMRELSEDADSRTWVALVDGVRVGFAMVALRGDEAGVAYVWTIEVLPGFRRMGVAGELLGRVEESAAAAGCGAIELHVAVGNLDAVALYEKFGYSLVRVEVAFYGPGLDGFRYRKTL